VNKRFRFCSHDQPFLLPPSLQDWLPENHLARFVADVMNELDLSCIYAKYERSDGRGLSAYHPVLMARLLLYGYCIGITSSRRIEQATYDSVAFRYLAADQHPDHDTLAFFRQEHVEALADLFVQALRLCQKAGLVKLGNVSIDGTKMKANASTRRSARYERISEREQHWRAEVARLPMIQRLPPTPSPLGYFSPRGLSCWIAYFYGLCRRQTPWRNYLFLKMIQVRKFERHEVTVIRRATMRPFG
jgi:transposase